MNRFLQGKFSGRQAWQPIQALAKLSDKLESKAKLTRSAETLTLL